MGRETSTQLLGRKIGLRNPPFIVAEMSGNHDQSLEKALEITRAAARAGAHALKLQTYTADTLTVSSNRTEFFITDEMSPWSGSSLYDLYQKAHTPWEWHEPIMKLSKELGMICFSSPFDESAVEFLERLGVPAYKIASFENTHLPLIAKVAATGKPLFLSTGMASLEELTEAIDTARSAGCKQLILLKCTSAYPADPAESNLLTIPDLRKRFDCEVGFSDHTLGIGAAIAAVSHGATVIEKHFTLRRADGGVDSSFSLEPAELDLLVRETENAWKALGSVQYGATPSENGSMQERRSLYVVKDLRRGDVLTEKNLRCIRPGSGLSPKYYQTLLGKRISRDTKQATPLSWDLIE